jgi:hypothetical protein
VAVAVLEARDPLRIIDKASPAPKGLTGRDAFVDVVAEAYNKEVAPARRLPLKRDARYASAAAD